MIQSKKIPEIQIGIFSGNEISFTLNNMFRESQGEFAISGTCMAYCSGKEIVIENDKRKYVNAGAVIILPVSEDASSFVLNAVTIGVDFHWQRKEDQVFKGALKLIIEDDKITAINIITIEDYLISVISSEMSATSSEELLRAHAVVSRSWLLAQMEKSRSIGTGKQKYESHFVSEGEIVRWWDREDHKNYDVCADDHCQRYQGITRASTPVVEKVIHDTFGEVLTSDGHICDTRYYKCCGGVTELFENVWEPVHHSYLQKAIDAPQSTVFFNIDLEKEENAVKWILGSPDAFCNTVDKNVLSEILNDYDQETNDFFRWKVSYSQKELSDLIMSRTGIDFGTVTGLIPVERGVSGRIIKLKIKGTLKTMTIGKELQIRKALSATHLYSSCFFVETAEKNGETYFILHGAGWGHGVGLCQIGAAVMGSKDYKYNEILSHYFKGAVLEKLY